MQDFLNIINKFKEAAILVVGDLILDEYLMGTVDRISPEAPIPILDVKEISRRPGGAANTAYNIKGLGGRAILAGVIGNDENGHALKNLLAEKGIDVQGIFSDSSRRTTLKARAVSRGQHIVRIDLEDKNPIDPGIEEKLFQFIESRISGIKTIIISDYMKGVVTPNLSKKIIELAKSHNVFSLVDGKAADFSKYRGCDAITPNKKELGCALNISPEQLSGEGRFLQAGKMLLAHVTSNNVLVKRGEQGMTLFGRSGDCFSYPATNKNPIDVSGAGDTAVATFALSLSAGADMKQAVILASYACGIGVGKAGTAVVYPEELKDAIKKTQDPTANN